MTLLCNYDAAATRLASELETLEVIGVNDYVHVTPHYMQCPYFAYVEAVDYERGRVICSHWSFGYVNEHGIEEVKLILKAEMPMSANTSIPLEL